MNHPFDLDQVRTGGDLVQFFRDVIQSMEARPHSLKLDGVNASIKVVEKNGVKQFAGDRGSNAEIDVSGIIVDRVAERWTPDPKKNAEFAAKEYELAVQNREINPEEVRLEDYIETYTPTPHGMIGAYHKVLDIFNSSIDLIRPELETLRMWDNPSRFFNIEYVEVSKEKKQTNVLEYENSYIAIHNLAQFYEKKGTGRANKKGPGFTSVDRPGLPRPTVHDAMSGEEKPTTDKGTPVPTNQSVIDRLVEKMRPIADEHGFKIYSSIPTRYKEGSGAESVRKEFEKVLNTPLTLCIDDEECPVQLKLKDWLARARNPKKFPGIWIRDKKQAVDPLNKDIYLWGIAQNKLVDILDDRFFVPGPDGTRQLDSTKFLQYSPYRPQKVPPYQPLIDGVVFWEAIKNLGNVVKRALTSKEFGDVEGQEGVVIRDKQFGSADVADPETGEVFNMPLDVKVTGDFIVQGLDTQFGKSPVNEISLPTLGASVLGMLDDDDINDDDDDNDEVETDSSIYDESEVNKIALFPGSFKPPHRGHLNVVKQLLSKHVSPRGTVRVIISDPAADKGSVREIEPGVKISSHESKQIWEMMLSLDDELANNVEVIISPEPSSYRHALKYIAEEGPGHAPSNSHVYMGCGIKGEDIERLKRLNSREDVKVIPAPCELTVKHSPRYIKTLLQNPDIIKNLDSTKSKTKRIDDFHAGDLRDLIGMASTDKNALELIKDFFPDGVDIGSIIDIIYQSSPEVKASEEISLNESKKKFSMQFLYSLVEDAINELSGVGAVSGYAGNIGTQPKPKSKKKKKETIKNLENN